MYFVYYLVKDCFRTMCPDTCFSSFCYPSTDTVCTVIDNCRCHAHAEKGVEEGMLFLGRRFSSIYFRNAKWSFFKQKTTEETPKQRCCVSYCTHNIRDRICKCRARCIQTTARSKLPFLCTTVLLQRIQCTPSNAAHDCSSIPRHRKFMRLICESIATSSLLFRQLRVAFIRWTPSLTRLWWTAYRAPCRFALDP